MATNILALPLAIVTCETSNNQDWLQNFKYVVNDGSTNTDLMPQFDLRGIKFEMEIRRASTDHEVLIHATTENRQIAIGAYPNYGYLLFNIPVEDMLKQLPGVYVADCIAKADGYARKIMDITLTVDDGVTKWTLEELAGFTHG
jgi:hypothetical protein